MFLANPRGFVCSARSFLESCFRRKTWSFGSRTLRKNGLGGGDWHGIGLACVFFCFYKMFLLDWHVFCLMFFFFFQREGAVFFKLKVYKMSRWIFVMLFVFLYKKARAAA